MSTAGLAPAAPLKLPSFATLRRATTRPAFGPRRVPGASLEVLDLITALAATVVALAALFPGPIAATLDAALLVPMTLRNALGLVTVVAVWPLVLRACGVYRVQPDGSRLVEAGRVAGAVAICVGLMAVVPATLGFDVLPARDLFHLWWIGTGLLLTMRVARRAVLRWGRRQDRQRVLIVGAGPRAATIHNKLSADHGYEVVGFVDDDATLQAPAQASTRVIGTVAALELMLMRHAIDEVFIALPFKSQYHQIQAALRACERVGVRAKYRADLFDSEVAWPSYETADGHVVTMHVTTDDYRLVIKRLVDLVASLALLVVLGPIMLLVAAAVKVTSPGPVLFGQDRYGLNRRPFRMLKFRTMVIDAEQQQDLLEDRNEADGPVFKISADPRITPVGRFLRRTSLDELPQLLNVLRGSMSLVGPRPLPLRDIARFTRASDMRRCSVRPGLTCLWQVSGRNNLSFDQWMQLDLQYIDGWSLLLDAEILARTVPAVLRRTGAH